MIWNKFAQVENVRWHDCRFGMNRIEEFHFQSCFFCFWSLLVRFLLLSNSRPDRIAYVRLMNVDIFRSEHVYQVYKPSRAEPCALCDYWFAGWCSALQGRCSSVSCFTPYANKQISKQNKRHPAKCAYKHMNKQQTNKHNFIFTTIRFKFSMSESLCRYKQILKNTHRHTRVHFCCEVNVPLSVYIYLFAPVYALQRIHFLLHIHTLTHTNGTQSE